MNSINRNGILLPEWVSLNHLKCKPRTRTISGTLRRIESVIPRPDLQRKPAVENTTWKGGGEATM